MKKKYFVLLKAILTGCEAIAVGLITCFCDASLAAKIDAAIVIGVKAVEEICAKFVVEDETKKVEE